AGMLTLGYAIAIIAFIRVGEKLLRMYGARKPMIWGCLITGLSIVLLSPANVLLDTYMISAVIGYTLFGVGLAFYATPSTDAALANLPAEQAGASSGIYKMASSLGAAFGVAISAAIFTAFSANNESINWLEGVITFAGSQDNLAIREAAIMALGFNVLMVVVAIRCTGVLGENGLRVRAFGAAAARPGPEMIQLHGHLGNERQLQVNGHRHIGRCHTGLHDPPDDRHVGTHDHRFARCDRTALAPHGHALGTLQNHTDERPVHRLQVAARGVDAHHLKP